MAKRLFGPAWRRQMEIAARFDQHFKSAQAGDPHSMLGLLDIFQDCFFIQGINDRAQIESLFEGTESSPATTGMIETLEFLFDDCRQVWSNFPKYSEDHWTMQRLMVDQAAASGSATAKLMQLERERWQSYMQQYQRGEGYTVSEREHAEVSALLNTALRTREHRAFAQARSFLNFAEVKAGTLHVDFWNHASCKYAPGCDLAMFQAAETHLFDHEIDTINEALDKFDQRLDSPEAIPFQKMFSHPIRLANGSLWFEYAD